MEGARGGVAASKPRRRAAAFLLPGGILPAMLVGLLLLLLPLLPFPSSSAFSSDATPRRRPSHYTRLNPPNIDDTALRAASTDVDDADNTDARGSSAAVVERRRSTSIRILAKTPETFKLADLYSLEAEIQCRSTRRGWGCERLAVDPATGSCLLRVELELEVDVEPEDRSFFFLGDDDGDTGKLLGGDVDVPPALRRCDWLAEEVASGSDAEGLLRDVRERGGTLRKDAWEGGEADVVGWTMEYICMSPNGPDDPPVPVAAVPAVEDDAAATSNGAASNARKRTKRKGYNSKTLMACVAQAIAMPAALDPDGTDAARLLLVEARSEMYLARKLQAPGGSLSSSSGGRRDVMKKLWPRRPFQYSSAINPTVAAVVVETLFDMAAARRRRRSGSGGDEDDEDGRRVEGSEGGASSNDGGKKRRLTLLDPTCGSGTFLAEALLVGASGGGGALSLGCDDNIYETAAMGWDVNPSCVEGARRNLEYILGAAAADDDEGSAAAGAEEAPRSFVVSVRDAADGSKGLSPEEAELIGEGGGGGRIDCVAANLPWGENTSKYHGENDRILANLATYHLRPGTPVAIVGKGTDDIRRSLERAGYDVLGSAHIPQRDFRLPGSRKKRKKKRKGTYDDDDDEEEEESGGTERVSRSGDCTVHFATAPIDTEVGSAESASEGERAGIVDGADRPRSYDGGDDDGGNSPSKKKRSRAPMYPRAPTGGAGDERRKGVGHAADSVAGGERREGADEVQQGTDRAADSFSSSSAAARSAAATAPEWETLGQIGSFSNRWLDLIGERLRDDRGQTLDYWRVVKDDSAVIITVHRGRFVLPRSQYRPGVGRITLDFPGGRVPRRGAAATGKTGEAGEEAREAMEAAAIAEDVVPAILEREMGVRPRDVSSLTALNNINPGGDRVGDGDGDGDGKGRVGGGAAAWPVNSSFSNQMLHGFVAVIRDEAVLDETMLHHRSYAMDVESDVDDLLDHLTCLQCRALLLEYLRLRRRSSRSRSRSQSWQS